MTQAEALLLRIPVIASIAGRSKAPLGRTAIMKLAYFLQCLKNVPLGYSFRLYTYGPYDLQLLEDLKVAEARGAIRSRIFEWKGGSGYEITSGDKADEIIGSARNQLSGFESSLDWVVEEFGERSAGELELSSTIIYVDQTSQRSSETLSLSQIVSRVQEVKPHLHKENIEVQVMRLKEKGLLVALQNAT